MEKFSKWADRSSGVNPFVPVLPRSPKSFFLRVPVSLLGFSLALVRMPLALSLLAMAAIGGVLSRYLPVVMAVWAAERAMNGFSSDRIWGTRFLLAIPLLIFAQFGVSIFRVFLVRIPLRLALGVMGIKVEEKHADLRRLGLRSPGAEPPSGRPSGGIYRGDIVVRNSCCFLEVLYLQSRITPQFTAIAAGGDTAPVGDWTGRGVLCREQFVGSMKWVDRSTTISSVVSWRTSTSAVTIGMTLPFQLPWIHDVAKVGVTRVRFGSAVLGCFRPSPSKLSKEQSLRDVITNPRGRTRSIVVSPEAARTNGAGILHFSRVFDSLMHPPSEGGAIVTLPRVHLVTFAYNRGSSGGRGFTPAQPVGSAWRQLFWLCSQVKRSTMEVSWVGAADVPRFPISDREAAVVARGGGMGSSRTYGGAPGPQSPAAWTEEIRMLMAAMIGRPKIALGSADFASFVEYYDLLQKGKKDEAAKLADKRSKN